MDSDKLKAVLSAELNAGPESIELTASATGKFNKTWFAESPEFDQPLVIRIAPPEDRSKMLFYEHRMMRQEPDIHRRIREKTTCPVPEILIFRMSDSRLNHRDFLIMERLPGEPAAGFADVAMEELGTRLREVHDRVRATPGRYGYLGEHAPMTPQPAWQEAFQVMWHALLDDIRNCGGYAEEEDTFFRHLLDREIRRFNHFREPAPLLHMDVWAENILTDTHRLTGLIDWDRACWGDPEIEFAVLEYCGVSTPGFWSGYAPDARDPRESDPDAAVRRIFYLLYEVQKYIVIRIARNRNPGGAERYREMARALASQID